MPTGDELPVSRTIRRRHPAETPELGLELRVDHSDD